MLSICDEKGSRLSHLKYQSHRILEKKPSLLGMPSVRGGETLEVLLKDVYNGTKVFLYYTVMEDLPVVLRHAEIVNVGESPVLLDRAYSFSLDMEEGDWECISLPGAHLRERIMERHKIVHGTYKMDSKRGSSSGQMNPFFALVKGDTSEDRGEAYGFNLVYSGSFAFQIELAENDVLHLVGGINDYDFAWELLPGERFITPEVVMVYSDEGLGDMSRSFHDLYRKYLINPRYVNERRPVVINNWEATYFDFDEKKLCDIIESVKGTGIDTFVLDDGWFGNRNSDKAGLGDWVVNRDKLPNGLKPVIDCAHQNGMKFGIWFEPEMVNPDSNLYKQHPDWAISVEGVPPSLGRDQLVLDLSRKDVRDYIVESVSAILRDNEIDYVKWDMNRPITDNYSRLLGKKSKQLHHAYILGLYDIFERIVNGFPHIFFEGCASGGCRFDPAALYYFPQIWTSDDSDGYMRTMIQYGTTFAYPVSSMTCHVSAVPNHQCGRLTPFSSRSDIAHLGPCGYELDTTKLPKEELDKIKGQVDEFRKMEEVLLFGDLYRLNEMNESGVFAFELLAKDKSKGHITAMRGLHIPNKKTKRLYPRGLDEKAMYYIPEIGEEKSGATWMGVGILPKYDFCDFATATYTLIRK
jgi:alpha-galactosidase